jgi:hypothetical protein
MARGWESKSVEDQIASAEERRRGTREPAVTPADRDRQSRRNGLLLSRAKLLRDLEHARDDRYRAQLHGALEFIDRQLEDSPT